MIGVCFKLLSIAPSLLEPGLFTKVHFCKFSSVDIQEFLTLIFDHEIMDSGHRFSQIFLTFLIHEKNKIHRQKYISNYGPYQCYCRNGYSRCVWELSCFEQKIHKFSAYKTVPKPIFLLWPACASYTGAVLFKVIPPNGASKRPRVSD